jgi:hypothetical protein
MKLLSIPEVLSAPRIRQPGHDFDVGIAPLIAENHSFLGVSGHYVYGDSFYETNLRVPGIETYLVKYETYES